MEPGELESLANLKYKQLLKIAKEKTGATIKKRLSKVRLIELVRASMMLMSDDEDVEEVSKIPEPKNEPEPEPEPMEVAEQPKRKRVKKAKWVLKNKQENVQQQSEEIEKLESTFTIEENAEDTTGQNAKVEEKNARQNLPRTPVVPEFKNQTKIPKLARPAPNFAQLHQKNFDQMQSLDEYIEKKRMRTATITSSTKPNRIRPVLNTPNSSAKPPPLKFDFTSGLDKPAFTAKGAVAVQKKRVFATAKENFSSVTAENRTGPSKALLSSKSVIEKPSEKKRAMLKGVRTNRRFELLMKHRESRKSGMGN